MQLLFLNSYLTTHLTIHNAFNLLNHSMSEWNVTSFRLHVMENNYSAMQLYQNLGFQATEFKKAYPEMGFNSWQIGRAS